MTRRARALLQGLRLAGAAAVIGAVAYLLSWRALWGGPSGSDLPYHLDLVSWVSKSFPSMAWWYRWDAAGTSFREGYPLTAHWLTVALSRMLHLGLSDAMQVFEFAITPLCAIGIYAFCAFRLRRTLVGLTAAVLSLLSPIAWTFLFDWGFYANQAGTVLFMPILIALDIFFEEWATGNRGWRYRGSALAVMALTALLGLVSPAIVAAPLLAIPAYGLAVRRGGLRRALRWVFVATPLLAGGAILLAAFWALPLQGYLASIGARQPAPVYTPSLFHLWSLDQVLGLHPLRPTIVQDRTSLSPAVWIPALVGIVAALWDGRLRAFLALIGVGFLTMTAQWFYAATFGLPIFPEIVTFRAGMLYLQFLVPILAGLGVIAVPMTLVRVLAGQLHVPLRPRLVLSTVLVAATAALTAAGVATFAERIDGNSHLLAYGAFAADVRDLWQHHRGDVCTLEQATNSLCSSRTLTETFSLSELVDACRDRHSVLRTDVPLCAALSAASSARWTSADDPLIASTVAWCQHRSDPICDARYRTLADQVLDLRQWRPPTTGCKLDPKGCEERAAQTAQYATIFPQAPKRAVLDAQAADLLKAFHDLTGGGQAGGYNSQLVSSPELDSWLQDGMLNQDGSALKAQLAAISGADAVVLGASQQGRAADYVSLGWKQVCASPTVYAPPAPSSIAVEWPSATRVLVVGSASATPSHPYNDIFKWASLGMLPVDSGWLVRGSSPYIDDYAADELSRYPVLLLDGYRYHDRANAWSRLDAYARNGGRLYIETGWQYVDPDWAAASAAVLPIDATRWGTLDPSAPVIVQGAQDTGWGSLTYGSGGWGASSSGGVRAGADALVSVGGRVVVARWQPGSGRVVWSGMNLMAHADATHSSAEQRFLAEQWRWLAPDPTPQSAVIPRWQNDDSVQLSLSSSTGPVDVLFKESIAPGWSAVLRSPGSQKQVPIEPAEMDFMAVHLDRVPSESTLIFAFGPTRGIKASWFLSALVLASLLVWLLRPSAVRPLARLAGRARREVSSRLRRRMRWDEEDEGDEAGRPATQVG